MCEKPRPSMLEHADDIERLLAQHAPGALLTTLRLIDDACSRSGTWAPRRSAWLSRRSVRTSPSATGKDPARRWRHLRRRDRRLWQPQGVVLLAQGRERRQHLRFAHPPRCVPNLLLAESGVAIHHCTHGTGENPSKVNRREDAIACCSAQRAPE